MSAAAEGRAADAILLGAGACTVLAGAAIAPALPALHSAIAGDGAPAWLARAALVTPALTIALTAPIAGALASRAGLRASLSGSLALLALSGAAGGLVSRYPELLLSRIVLGFACALAFSAATAMIAARHDGAARTRMLAGQSAANTWGGVVFLVLGGILAMWSWRAPFALYLLAAPLAALAPVMLRERRESRARAQWVAPPPRGLWPLVLGMGLFYLIPTRIPFMLVEFGVSPAGIGAIVAAATVAAGGGAMAAPRLSRALGDVGALALAAGAASVGLLSLPLAASAEQLAISSVVLGAGFGVVPPLATMRVLATTPPARRAAASGWIASALFGGQMLSLAVGEPIAAHFGPAGPFWAGVAMIAAATSAGALGEANSRYISRTASKRSRHVQP